VEYGETAGQEGHWQDEASRYSEPGANPPKGWSKLLREMYPHENELASARFEFDDNHPKRWLKVGAVVLARPGGNDEMLNNR
jgi:hypothetical protein